MSLEAENHFHVNAHPPVMPSWDGYNRSGRSLLSAALEPFVACCDFVGGMLPHWTCAEQRIFENYRASLSIT
jgi:hypothetical protein